MRGEVGRREGERREGRREGRGEEGGGEEGGRREEEGEKWREEGERKRERRIGIRWVEKMYYGPTLLYDSQTYRSVPRLFECLPPFWRPHSSAAVSQCGTGGPGG